MRNAVLASDFATYALCREGYRLPATHMPESLLRDFSAVSALHLQRGLGLACSALHERVVLWILRNALCRHSGCPYRCSDNAS